MANGDTSMACLPEWLKVLMVFIDRVGFPILAFLLMFYMSVSAIGKVNQTLEKTMSLLTEWQVSTIEFRKMMVAKQDDVLTNQKAIIDCVARLKYQENKGGRS